MTQANVIRAWKDEDFRLSLSEAELAALPANPAGAIELKESQLDPAAANAHSRDNSFCTLSCSCWCICA